MRRFLIILGILGVSLFPLGHAATLRAATQSAALPGIGRTVVLQGFAMTLVSATRAHEAGGADYIAGKGKMFVFVTVRITRHGAHESYVALPVNFQIMTSNGVVVESEQFGVASELGSRSVGRTAISFKLGFEIPAHDNHLQLVWQPSLASNPDAQATWNIGAGGKTIQYLQ